MSGVRRRLDRKIRRRESRAASRIEHVLWPELLHLPALALAWLPSSPTAGLQVHLAMRRQLRRRSRHRLMRRWKRPL